MADEQGQNRPNRPMQPREVVVPTGPVTVQSGVTVKELSHALGIPVASIIKIMMGLGEMVTITQSLSDEAVGLIAADPSVNREVTIKHADEEDDEPEAFDDPEESLQARPPVVTIMGHVDHGKTTLLDAIRESAVVETEAGGITQHIGAYQVEHDGRKLTFLDTPGHEAFTAMRARGAKVTDIAVLVVAADDGVMPQTKESISHARAAEVPIVVAVNKIDVPDADPNRVRGDLAGEGLQPEEWGGTTQFSEVSAKQQQNLDDLLEKVILVADAELELTANPEAEASGPIIESRLDVGRGPAATMLVQRGTLKVGDAIVAGDAWGRVRALYDFRGEKLQEARPGDPVEILGFDHPPPAGEMARVVEDERHARHLAQNRGERLRRGRGLRAPEDSASRGRRPCHPSKCGRHHRRGRQPGSSLERPRGRLQRAAERGGARPRRARRRRDPHLPRDLPPDGGHRAGAGRHARAGDDRGDARRGRGAPDLPCLAARNNRRLLRHQRDGAPQRAGARGA